MQAAMRAAEDRDFATARNLLRAVLRENPDHEMAWLWMSQVAETDRERRLCLRQVLRINPENDVARRGLKAVDARAETETVAAAAPEPEPIPVTPATVEPELASKPSIVHEPEPAAVTPVAVPLPPEPVPVQGRSAAAPDRRRSRPAAAVPRPAPEVPWPAEQKRPAWVVILSLVLVSGIVLCLLAVAVVAVPQLLGEGRQLPFLPTADFSVETPSLPEAATPEAAPLDLVPSLSPTETISEGVPTEEAPAGEPDLPGAAGPLADLTVVQVRIALEGGDACDGGSSELGTMLVIENEGAVDAPPFEVEVNDERRVVDGGLAAGQQVSLWFSGYAVGAETIIVLDAGSQVEEMDEDDNLYAEQLPVPTLPPTCTPPPPAETPVPAAAQSVVNTAKLAPIRFTSRSIYSDASSSYLQVEVDAQGNVRIAVDLPARFEEWYVIGGVVHAGAEHGEGLQPYQVIESPADLAGFAEPFDVFAPRGAADRFTPSFPLHAVLWRGVGPERAQKVSTERMYGLMVDKYRVAVAPEEVPANVAIAAGVEVDLAAAVAEGGDNATAYCWVEPDRGAIVKAEWNVTLTDGKQAQFRFEATPMDVGPFQLP